MEYVQESVYENYGLKKRIFSEIEENASKDTIIASSSSALSISEIQKSVKRPQRCLIAHPINPVHIIPLVEVVPGSQTSKATVDMTYEFMSSLGKAPLICKKEVPGFIVNRLQSAIYREAFDLIGNGVATIEDVDKAVTAGLGLRWAFMGPFLVMHLAGGKGGIEYRLEHLGESQKIRWESMASWTSIPEVARTKAVQEIKEYRFLKGRSYEKIRDWRDEKLIKLLKFFNTI